MVKKLVSGRWWIDGGEFCQPNSDRSDPIGALAACQELGVVILDQHNRSIILQWDVDRAGSNSIAKASVYLDSCSGADRISLRFFKNGWCAETYWSAAGAISRMLQICSHRYLPGPTETVIEDKDLSRAQSSESLIQAAFLASKEDDFSNLSHSLGLHKYSVVLGKRGKYDSLRYLFVGKRSEFYETYGPDRSESTIGEGPDLIRNQEACENRLSQAYETCLATDEPVYQHARANLQLGTCRNWTSFQRIVIPVKENEDTWLVYSFAKFTDQIDIPFLGRVVSNQ